MTQTHFRVTVKSQQDPPVVVASGDIDLANVGQFSDVLTKAAAGSSTLTVDLSEVTYCDSAAVRALFGVAAATEVKMIVSDTGPIKTLLAISGLDRVANVVVKD